MAKVAETATRARDIKYVRQKYVLQTFVRSSSYANTYSCAEVRIQIYVRYKGRTSKVRMQKFVRKWRLQLCTMKGIWTIIQPP